jgi:hypothetical protein
MNCCSFRTDFTPRPMEMQLKCLIIASEQSRQEPEQTR